MRRFATRAAPALLAFLLGVGASCLWRVVMPQPARSISSAGYGAERAQDKFIRRAGGIPGRYIVVLGDDTRPESVEAIAAELTRAHGGQVQFVYRYALKGFSVTGAPVEAAAAMSRDPLVRYVDSDVMSKLQ